MLQFLTAIEISYNHGYDKPVFKKLQDFFGPIQSKWQNSECKFLLYGGVRQFMAKKDKMTFLLLTIERSL